MSEARIGLVPALNQIALAIDIFLLLPLGDRFSNRRLCLVFVALQTAAMILMALSTDFAWFTVGSTLLGFVTIAPYLLPAFASRHVAPERLGHVTALLTAGVIFGILIARVGAGVIAELYGWRPVYWIASALMLTVTLLLPIIMRIETAPSREHGARYRDLPLSVFSIANQHREVLLSAAIQALNFGMFIASWLAIALHLTGDQMGYGTDTVGYLAGLAAIGIFTTPRLGRWADRIGPQRACAIMAVVQLIGIALLWPLGDDVLTLIFPLLIVNLVGPGIDVTGRMTFLSLEPELRTRLTTIYIVIMFIGGGAGSFLGTASYGYGAWTAICALILTASAALTTLSLRAARN